MVILGLADGPRACAAVVRDDELVASVVEERVADAAGPFPWAAATRALELAGVAPDQVSSVAWCGRYTPPLAVRQRPELWRLARDPFSPALAAGTALQRLLRDTGLGAASADRATDWAADTMRARGYRPRKVQLVDVHKCAASAAYRTQPQDHARVLVVNPRGDGALATVWEGIGGQLDRLSVDRGPHAAHAWLERVLAVLGLSSHAELRALASTATPDPVLVDAFRPTLSWDGAFRARRGPERRRIRPWTTLVGGDRAVGAASALEVLREALTDFAKWHALDDGRTLLLAGTWFEDEHLPGRIAEATGAAVQVTPFAGVDALGIGAAAAIAGLPPRDLLPEVGSSAEPGDLPPSEPADDARVAELLSRGEQAIRWVGREATGPAAVRNRGVWVRADDAAAVARCRERLQLSAEVAPVHLLTARPDGLPERLSGWQHGSADREGVIVGPVPELGGLFSELVRRGVTRLTCWPVARRGRRPARTVAEAAVVFAESGLDALVVGDRMVLRSGGELPR